MRNGLLPMLSAAVALVPVAGLGQTPDGADDQRAVAFELGAGIEYDSNVAVLELDTSTNAGDAAARFDFGVGYNRPAAGRLDLRAGYSFSETVHADFDDFDLRIHRGSATVGFDLEKADTGAMFQYARAELDGQEFLALTQVSPFVSKLLGERLFLRFAYIYSDKDFAANPGRAAKADSWSSDVYVFVNGLETYLLFGYRHDTEDAIDAQFDYAGRGLRAQLSRRIAAGSRELTLKVGVRFEQRDYDNPTLSIGAPRGDDRFRFEASADIPLGARTTARIGYKHADHQSNLPSVDFNEDVYSVAFSAEL